jgi:hypothetical protein
MAYYDFGYLVWMPPSFLFGKVRYFLLSQGLGGGSTDGIDDDESNGITLGVVASIVREL